MENTAPHLKAKGVTIAMEPQHAEWDTQRDFEIRVVTALSSVHDRYRILISEGISCMHSTFAKLNLKGHDPIVVLNPPSSFERELATLHDVSVLRAPDEADDISFWLVFVTRQQEVDELARIIARSTMGDTIVWFAYPKGSSKRYKSEINRDRGWQILGDLGFEPVRSVAMDEDWSAVRFRREAFIKTMIRKPEHRMTAQARARAAKGGTV